jgi:hypothetical protein
VNDFVEIYITPEMVLHAQQMADSLGTLNRSIMNGSRNLAGFLGELVFEQYYPEAIRDNTYDSDFLFHGSTVDVKTKVRGYKPKPDYEVSVSAYRLQKTNVYYFVSLLEERGHYTKAYLLGWASSKDFLANARFLKKGQLDPSNNYTVRADCYNLEISKLRPIKRRWGNDAT